VDLMKEPVIVILLVAGISVEILSCIGVLVIEDVFDRLHYLGPACTLGPVFIAAAIVVSEGFSPAGNKAIVVAATIVATSPVLTHATARAARARGSGHLSAFQEELVEKP
jgi:multicomponent Na+:H+ antiporter subunit G